jgi:hypothetical protein
VLHLAATSADAAAVITAAYAEMARAAGDYRDALVTLAGVEEQTSHAADSLRDASAGVYAAERLATTASADLAVKLGWVAGAAGPAAERVGDLRNADWELAAAEHAAGDAAITMAAKTDIAGKAMDNAGQRAFRFWGLTRTALHWIVAAGAEILAVVGPALIAAGAWAAVIVQGATNAGTHMWALWQATEATSNMFHESAGQALGLKGALQQAQDAANPMVYQNLGSALIIVREHFQDLASTGLQVERIFTTFMAKLAYEFSPGGNLGSAVDGLLKAMVPDLIKIAQVLGNTVHALAGFANSMPGLAEVLLGVLRDITGLASALANNPIGHYLFLIGMGFEESWRWGGLFGRLLGRLAGLLGTAGEHIAVFAYKLGAGGLGKSVESASGVLGKLAGFLSGPWGWVTVAAAAGLGVLIYKIATMKDATQQWVDSLQSATQAASNFSVYGTIVANMTKLTNAYASAKGQYDKLVQAGSHGQIPPNPHWLSFQTQKLAELHQGMTQQQQDMTHVGQGMAYLATTYKTSYVGALALAQEAGVNLSQNILGQGQQAEILRFKIASLVAGYQAMGQPASVVGKDMDALSIASMEQQSKVQQLNQAWDSFMQNLTGGTSNLAQYEQSVTGLTSATSKFGNILGKQAGSVTLTANDFAKSLQSATGKGAQAWQNFNQVVGSTAPQLIDWLRTAGSEGELSGTKFTQAVRDIVAQMLPFAKDSKTATAELSGLAQMANGPATSSFQALKNWTDQSHTSVSGLQSIINSTTQKMGDMAQVAQNLGAVMQTDIISTMDQAKLKVDNVGQATIGYTQTLQNNNSTSQQVHGSYDQMVRVLTQVTGNNKEANTIARTYARSMGDDTEKAYKYTQQNHALAGSLAALHNKTIVVTEKGTGQYTITGAAVLKSQGKGGSGNAAGGLAAGGIVHGGVPHQDSVHALLMPGEGVLTTKAVGMLGEHTVHSLNRMAEGGAMHALRRMASGGIAGSYQGDPGGLAPFTTKFDTTMTSTMTKAMEASITKASKAAQAAAAASAQTFAGGLGRASLRQIENYWIGAGGPGGGTAHVAAAITGAESGFNPRAVQQGQPYATTGWGLWQITPGDSEPQFGIDQALLNPMNNARAAVAKYRAAGGFSPWTTFMDGAYLRFMDQGGWLSPGLNFVMNGTGRPEYVPDPNGGQVACCGHDVNVYLDSKLISRSTQQELRRYNRRNGPRGSNKALLPGG